MEQDYVYDIFLSYRRKPPVGDWVRNHFYPLIEKWLPLCMPYEPKIFIDLKQIETGAAWPLTLKNALKTSRCLMPVWSEDYFRSTWCMAEWKTFVARERLLEVQEDQDERLIYPVRFFGGDYFPEEAKRTQQRDLSRWNNSSLAFADTEGFVELETEIQSVVVELRDMIQKTPHWRDWPVITPDTLAPAANQPVTVGLPRFQ